MTPTDKPPAPTCDNCGAAMSEMPELFGVMVHDSYECVACAMMSLPSELAWMAVENNPLGNDVKLTDEVARYCEAARALGEAVLHADKARLVLGEAGLNHIREAIAPCDLDKLLFYVVQAQVLDRENVLVPVPPNRVQRRAGMPAVPAVVLAVVLTPGPALREQLPALPVFAPRTVGEA